jgi:AcrR family transcriptional regulator
MGRRPGIDGRELILAAALKLFSEHGIDAVSIRAVNREAGLGPASVHYHFGTKEALVDAVISVHGTSVIETTNVRAREILASESPAAARDLVTMMAEPYLDVIAGSPRHGSAWVRVISSLLQSDPERILDRPSARLTWKAACMTYPEAAPATVERGMRMCLSLLVTQLARTARPGRNSGNVDLALLIDFLSAGLDGALRVPAPTSNRRARAS